MQKPWWKEPTRGQWAAFSAAWVGWVLDAFDFTIFLMVQNEIAKEMGVGVVALSGSITLTLLVRLAGGFVAGWMADRWGRKLPLMLSLVWFAVFDAAIYFAPSFVWIVVLRTIFGFGMGAEWTAGTAMAMENWPARSRKLASGLLQAGWPIGFLLSALVSHFVVDAYGWRMMFLIAAVPALLVLPIRFMVPEENAGGPKRVVSGAATSARPISLRDLWAPGVRQMIVVGSLVMGLGFLVYYGLTASYGTMLVANLGFSAETARMAYIWFNVGMLVGVICAGWFANRYGVVAALVTPALLMVPALPLYAGAAPSLLPLGAFLGGALGVGYSGVTPVLTTSLFPEHVRGRAIGIVYHVGAMIGAFAPLLVGYFGERVAYVEIPAGGPGSATVLAPATALQLQWSIPIVAGTALILMAAAILLLRRRIVPAELAQQTQEPAPATGDGPRGEIAARVAVQQRGPERSGRRASQPAFTSAPPS